MNKYQKLAILIVRLVALAWIGLRGFAWTIYGVEALSGVHVKHYPAHTILGNIALIVGALLVFAFAKPIGGWLGRDLGEQA